MNLCKCGCGTLVRGIWSKGHCNRKPKPPTMLCMCGCGQTTNSGCKWLSGHNSKSISDKEKKSEMFKRLWKEGKFEDRRVWNDGLTIETSEKLKEVGRKISAAMTVEKRAQISQTCIRKEIHPPFMLGSDHPNWKGGITDIRHLVASDLYEKWKYPILERDGFSCTVCFLKDCLEVHHDKISMSEILHKIVPIIDRKYTWEEKKEFVRKIIDYHVSNEVSGITLCEECHKDAHSGNS